MKRKNPSLSSGTAVESYESPVGTLYLVATAKGLSELRNSKPKGTGTNAADAAARKMTERAKRELMEYFAGKRSRFEVPLDLEGTEFQKKVWEALLTIPYGTTLSYRDIARRVRKPKAMRAVGNANGKNPVCIVVPCHRVIAADGSLGGYSSGLPMKRKLLALESQSTTQPSR